MGRSRLGVRARLTLVAVGAAAVGLSVGGWLLYRDVTDTLGDALTHELRGHARDVADEVARGVPPSPSRLFALIPPRPSATGMVQPPVLNHPRRGFPAAELTRIIVSGASGRICL